MSVTASRELVENLCRIGIPLLVLHDFDKSGLLDRRHAQAKTRRYGSSQPAGQVIDLGLRLDDIAGLESSSLFSATTTKAAANLSENGATKKRSSSCSSDGSSSSPRLG